MLAYGQCLQNGGDAIVRLTSRGESPYFSKLDSSFCQIRAARRDRLENEFWRLVSKLRQLWPIRGCVTGSKPGRGGESIRRMRAGFGSPQALLQKMIGNLGGCGSHAWYI